MLKKLAARFSKNRREDEEPTELAVFMHPVEYSQLLAVIEAVAPKKILEWGSGGSTKVLLERLDYVEKYVSIEHNAQWYERVRDEVQDPRLTLHLSPPVGADEPNPPQSDKERSKKISAWMLLCETDPAIMAEYVAWPATLGETFDFVLVDGRARIHCLRQGWQLLREGGVIVIHDAQRQEYRETIDSLGRAIFLEPWHQGQICFIRKPEGA